ncbi:MAG: hypothetical protein PWP28_1928 [Oceanotoga sp.]|uniref:hypothetical protein n=1 Tax=Oceanotoga sp. TaxID=2108366 RepID=UPI002652860C|nr:hypothetical protein [Oceanotoga sp.]MDN5343053.1 hypothetical protein [Oceanotoga sp.]
MKNAIVINIYLTTEKGEKHPFDHPTPLEEFEEKNTFFDTLKSINELEVPENEEIKLYIFAIAANEITKKDNIIYEKVNKLMNESRFEYEIYTNTDILNLREKYKSDFFSVKGYPEIRNQGFIIPLINKEDIIIQIDDDELLRKNYFKKTVKILKENPDKFIITAPYEKNGTVRIMGEDPVKSWKKFSSMDMDIIELSKDENIKESTFGFGGNMIVRKEFAEKMLYPLDVPRGEDFSLLLASRLIYENGNKYINISKKQNIFRSYYISDKDLTIIHKPPVEAKKDIMFYIEKNMKRFIMEWNMFINQEELKIEDLKKLSNYLYYMIGYQDMKEYLKDILKEVEEKYTDQNTERLKEELLSFMDKWNKNNKNRFEDYKKVQRDYINFINKIRTN